MEFMILAAFLIGIGTGFLCGYCNKIHATKEWKYCKFKGDPPKTYKNWQDFVNSDLKQGVFVRAATIDDFKN